MTDEWRSIKDINENCLDQFRTHWQCLENHNQQLWNCRSEERRLNKCVFDKLVRGFVAAILCISLTMTETGEDDTRYTKGRDPGPSADEEYLCVSLNLYITLAGEGKHIRIQIKFKFCHERNRCRLCGGRE